MKEIREITLELAKQFSEKKAKNIAIIDISEKSSFADYFLNVTAGSERQLGAFQDLAEEKAVEMGLTAKSIDGRPGTGWILMDFGDLIINIFTEETRDKYSLERIWSDCDIEYFE